MGDNREALISFDGLKKAYSKAVNVEAASMSQALFGVRREKLESQYKWALKGVSGTFCEGDVLGIIGENGAGKSTLLHIISGITDPTEGSVQINGEVSAILTIGIGLRELASGRENIYIDGQIKGLTRAQVDNYIDEVIEFAELGEFIDRPLRTYSTGMKARLAFSMNVTLEPDILIIDEALGAGDYQFGQKATKKIKEICGRGKLVIIVSHGLGTIRSMCNRCLWMHEGKILKDGHPDEVVQSYVDFVRERDEKQLIAGACRENLLVEQFGREVKSLEMGEGFIIKIPDDLYKKDFQINVSRLDGLEICEILPGKKSKWFVFQSGVIVFPFNFLGRGHYKFQLTHGKAVMAESFIEVKSPRNMIGGIPLISAHSEIKIKSRS